MVLLDIQLVFLKLEHLFGPNPCINPSTIQPLYYNFDRFRLYSHDRIQSVSDNAQASVQGAS